MTAKDLATWLRRKLRFCYSLHECKLCKQPITLGQYYRDGGYGRRAHDACVGKPDVVIDKTHGCKDCGEERFPRIVARKATCPECGSENIVCLSETT